MFFVEPPPSAYDVRFNVGGVPVRIHPFFWIITLVLGASVNPDPANVILWIVAEFACILVHEFGHVMAFRYYGIASHVVLYGFGGLTIPLGPTNMGAAARVRRDWLANVVISLAGPVAGFAFAAVILLGLAAAGRAPTIYFSRVMLVGMHWRPLPSLQVDHLIWYMQIINIFWGLMNLLPIFPLDGGQVSRAVFDRLDGADGLRRSLWLSLYAAAAAAIFCYVQWQSIYMALMFAYMGYQNYQILQQISGMGRGGRW